MNEYLLKLYDWVSSKDASFSSKMTKETFIQRMENEPEYNNKMHTWISKKDPKFNTRLPLNEFQKKTLKKKDTLDSDSEVGLSEPTKVYDPISGELLGEVKEDNRLFEKKEGFDDFYKSQEDDVDIYKDVNIQTAIDNGLISDEELILAGYKQPGSISTISTPSELDKEKAKNKILAYRSKTKNEISSILDQEKLNSPYAYVDSSSEDSFVEDVFGTTDLALMNINPKDFDGFLEKKGYKKDFINKEKNNLFDSSYMTLADPKLSLEIEKARMLNLYISEQVNRDIKYQKLIEERDTGINPDNTGRKYNFKPSQSNVKLDVLDSYVQKNMPILTKKLNEVQEKNKTLYKEYMEGGMSIGTLASSMSDAASIGVRDRINQMSASAYDLLSKTGIDYFSNTAESIRLQMDQDTLSDFDPSTYGYVSGRRVEVNGRNYLVDESDQIYDLDIKKRVTSFLDASITKEILNKSIEEGVEDSSYSTAGVAIQTSNVVGDMLVQIALTKGAASGISRAGALTEGFGILSKTKDVLRAIPMSRGVSASMIAQGTMGLSSGYEQTLKLAKDNGLNENEARELAQSASIQMGVLYTLTAPISPQTKATEAIFGKIKNETIKNAVDAYIKVGKKGFVKTFQDAGKKVLNYTGEGVKEVFQENIQQTGEMMVVNKNINDQAGRKIAKDTITGDDFINTTILSFTAGILMPGAGSALTSVRRKARDIMGLSGVDRMKSLDYLVRNEDKLNSLLESQIKKGVYTQEDVDNLKSEIKTYKDGVGKIPKNLKPKVALEVMSDIAKIRDLESERKQLDPAFHQEIDDKINNIREEIKKKTSKVEETKEEVLEETKDKVLEETKEEVLEETKEEPFITEKKKEKLEDALDRPITLTELGGSKLDAPIEGDLYVEGQQVVVEDADGRITEIGNVDEISGSTLEELGVVPVESEVKTDNEGNIVFNGETLVPEVSGIKRNKKGNISRVVLRNSDGSITRTLRGSNAEDAAYQILLKEATSPEQEQRINEILEQNEEFQNEFRETTDTTESETDTDTKQDTTEQSTEVESEGLSKLRAAFNKKSTTSGKVNKLKEKVNIDNLIPAAKASLSKLFPDIEIEAFYNEDEYHRAIGDEDQSGGAYIDNKVYINLTRASKTTVAHEVFHAILAKSLGSNTEIQNLTKRFVDALINGNDKNVVQALADKVDTIEQYKDVANEEIMAELFGILAGFGKKLKPETKSLVRRFLDQVAKILGLKKFTENELIDVLNTLSQKVAKGEVITSEDINIFESEQGSSGAVGTFNVPSKKSISAPSISEDNREFSSLLEQVDLREFNGESFVSNMYDYTTAGKVDFGNGLEINLFGGKNYVPYMMNVKGLSIGDKSNLAAFNTKAQAENFIRNSIKGKASLFAPHAGTLKGSWQFQQKIFEELMNLIIDNNLVSNSDLIETFNEGLVNKKGNLIKPFTTFLKKYNKDVNNLNNFKDNPKELIDLLSIEKNFSPDLRKRLSDKIIANKDFKKAIGIKSKEDFYDMIMDPMNKGVVGGEIMGVVRFDPKTFEIKKTKKGDIDHHESFGYTLLSNIEGIYQPTEFHKSYDLTEKYTKYNKDKTIVSTKDSPKFIESNVSSSAGSIPKVASFDAKKQITGNNANDIVKYAKENNISDADIRAFGKELGIDSDEINKAIDKYNSNIGISVTEIRKRSEENIKKRVKKKSLKERTRIIREKFLDRQTRIKDVLKGINSKQAKAALAKIVTKAGASGYANFRFKEADKKIYKNLSTSDKNTLDEIIYASRIISINKNRRSQGKEEYKGIEGYNDNNAQRDLDNIKDKVGDKKFNDLMSRSKEYFKVFDASLKRMFEADLISEEVYEQLRDLDYSPIKTIKYILPENSNVEEIDRVALTTGVTKDAIKSLSDENVNDIVTDTRWLLQTNLSMIEATIFENRMLNAFNDAISQATDEEKKAINEIILDNPIVGSYKDGRPKRKYDEKYDNINYKKVFFKKDGVSDYMVVSKVHAEQLLDVKTKPGITSKVIQVGSGTNVLRFFATAGNPLFIVGNTAVDFANILFLSDTYSKNKFVGGVELAADFVKNTISKMTSTNSYKKTYEEYMIHGGSIDYLATDGLKSLESLKPAKKILKVPVSTMKAIGKTLSYLGETSEISFRIAVYEKSKSNQIKAFKKNNNREPNADEMEEIMFEATREARETIDFSQGGSATKAADKVLPYLNASTQGFRKAIDYANNNPAGFVSNMIQASLMAGSMMAGSLFLLMRGLDDDDDIEEVLNRVSDYEKSNYHIFFTGKKDEDGEYDYYRVRKLPTISVFSTLAEQLVIKAALKSKGVDYDINGEVMEKSLLNALPIIPKPTAILQRNPLLSGLITYNTNYDMFYDQPVFVGPRGKKIAPEAEGLYDPRVNNIYKDFGAATGMSPKRSKAFLEKIITSETTNPVVGLIYSGYDAFTGKTEPGKEITSALESMFNNVSKKVKRKTNKNLPVYKSRAEDELEETRIETEIYKKEQEVYNLIKKNHKGNKTLSKEELKQIVTEKFDKIDHKKYLRKYTILNNKKGVDREILDIVYEDTPEVQALLIFNKFGDSFEDEEENKMKSVFKAARRKFSKKAMYIYNKKYKKK